MSPVNVLGYEWTDLRISGFTALSIEQSLYIFGGRQYGYSDSFARVLKWDGTFWYTVGAQLCTPRVFHTTIVYGGVIYHMGNEEMTTNR